MLTTTYPAFISTIFPVQKKISKITKNILLVLVGTLALAISSKLSIPFYPVPMTMQTFVVLLIGGIYEPKLSVATVLTYLLQGAIGLPVFTNGAGLAYMAGPTGGYLFGFLAAVLITSISVRLGHDRQLSKSLPWFALGHTIIFVFGVAWLSYLFGLEKALKVGLYPFIPGAIIKFILASISLKSLWNYFPSSR